MAAETQKTSSYIKGIENDTEHYYRLDLKLLDEDNAIASLERMASLWIMMRTS